MKILIISPYYDPDFGPSSPLITILSEDLVELGHQVYVISMVPHYPTGFVPKKYRKGLFQWENNHSLKICRLRIPSGNRSNLYHRLLIYIVYQIQSTFIGSHINPDVLLITNPALETFLPFFILRKMRKIPVLNCVWDLYPDVGIQAGIFKNQLVVKSIDIIEQYCLNRSSLIQVFTESFRKKLVDREIDNQKIIIIEPWLADGFFNEIPQENSFAFEYNLVGKFVILYAGNIGYSQDLEHLLYTAELLKNERSYIFTLVGDGPKKEDLVKLTKKLALSNIKFIPFLDKERISEIYASADISIVSQKSGIGSDSLPSKIINILASKRPVIAITDPGSSLAEIIISSKSGICVHPNDEHSLARAIENLKNNPSIRNEYGTNGYNYALNHFHHRQASLLFEQALFHLSG